MAEQTLWAEAQQALLRGIEIRQGAGLPLTISEWVDVISPEPRIPASITREVISDLLHRGVLWMDEDRHLVLVNQGGEGHVAD